LTGKPFNRQAEPGMGSSLTIKTGAYSMQNTPLQNKPACQICGCDKRCDLRRSILVRPLVADLIKRETGNWIEDGWICTEDLQTFRHKYIKLLLKEEKGEISSLEDKVIESLQQQELLAL